MFPEGDKPGKVVSKLCFLKVEHCFLAMFPKDRQTRKHCFLAMFPHGGQTSNVSYPTFPEDGQLENTGTDSHTCWLNLLGSEVQVLIWA